MSLLTNRMAEPRMRTDDRLSTIVISTSALDDLIVFWQDGLITIVSLVQPSHMTKSQVFAKQFSQDSNKNSFIVFAENSESIFVLRLVVHLGNFDGWDKKKWQKVDKRWQKGTKRDKKWQKVDTSDSFCSISWRKAGKSRIPLSVSSIWKNPLIICIRMLTTEKPWQENRRVFFPQF